jgi:hypothetical protein
MRNQSRQAAAASISRPVDLDEMKTPVSQSERPGGGGTYALSLGIMRRKLIMIGLVIASSTAVTVAWLSLDDKASLTATPLTMGRQQSSAVNQTVSNSPTNVLPDFFQMKYPFAKRAQFHVSSRQPVAVFVLATGVQVQSDSGWHPYSEEPRNEIWRLKPDTAQDMFVEIPEKQTEHIWRAYIRYGTEMRGAALVKAQVREAWKIRSFSNWTGRAWGGGRFRGLYELFSEEFSQ